MNKTVKTLTAAALGLTLAGALSACGPANAPAHTGDVGLNRAVPGYSQVLVNLSSVAEVSTLARVAPKPGTKYYEATLTFSNGHTGLTSTDFQTDPVNSVYAVGSTGFQFTPVVEYFVSDTRPLPYVVEDDTAVDLNRVGASVTVDVYFNLDVSVKVTKIEFGYGTGRADVLSWSL